METLKFKYISLWYNTDSKLNLKGNKVTHREKIQNEKKIERFRIDLFKKLKHIPAKDEEESFKNEIINDIKSFESSLSPYNDSLIDFFYR